MFAAEDTLFVLWGFSSEDAGLSRPSLDALLQQRLSRYLSSLLQQSPCVITAEEFALHADTLAQEFPHIILVQNTCYRTLLSVSVTLTPEMQSGLLSHFDPETPQDAPLPGIEPCLRVYSNLLHTEEGIACCIPLDALLRQYPQVERVSLGAAPHTVPETAASSSAFALTGEADYFCLVQQLRRGTTQEGAEYSVVDPFISEFFHWLEQSFAVLHSGETCRYLPVDDSAQGSQRLTPALGVLEELDLLHFALLGGSNSRLYLYINQTQTLELADRGFYRNHLLERIAQRHTDAVRLMSWLFTSGFSSDQLWDRIEEYFLGLPIQGFDAPSAESR